VSQQFAKLVRDDVYCRNKLSQARLAGARHLAVASLGRQTNRCNQMRLHWKSKAAIIWTFLMSSIVLLIILAAALWPSTSIMRSAAINGAERIASCNRDTLNLIGPEKVDIDLLEKISNYCYLRVRNEQILDDFPIRHATFVRQQFDSRVLLWMVVTITFSGVVLAALQLLAAYRLAVAGRAGDQLSQQQELTLEQNKISLKSSVTGLLILVTSLAFFIIYVSWVFTIREIPLGRDQKVSGPQNLLPGVGGLGSSTEPSGSTQ
jgi:hypothetical protein